LQTEIASKGNAKSSVCAAYRAIGEHDIANQPIRSGRSNISVNDQPIGIGNRRASPVGYRKSNFNPIVRRVNGTNRSRAGIPTGRVIGSRYLVGYIRTERVGVFLGFIGYSIVGSIDKQSLESMRIKINVAGKQILDTRIVNNTCHVFYLTIGPLNRLRKFQLQKPALL